MENMDHLLVLVKMKYFENYSIWGIPQSNRFRLVKDSKVFCMIHNYFSDVLCNLNLIMKQFLFLELLKWFYNTKTTAHGQKMNTKKLDLEKVIGDFKRSSKMVKKRCRENIKL